MLKKTLLLVTFVVLVAPSSPAQTSQAQTPQAQTPGARFKVLLDGAFGLSHEFNETRSFEEFAETGSLTAGYKSGTGPGVAVGLQYDVARHVGIRGVFAYVKRDGTVHYDARLPHPLYLNQPRSVSADASNLSYGETSEHLDLVLTKVAGPLDLSFFAGGSLIKVKADLVGEIQKAEAYPYDQVTITGITKASASDSAFGFNVGAGVDYRFGERWSFGAQFLFSRAKAKLAAPAGDTVGVNSGGAHLTSGFRFRF